MSEKLQQAIAAIKSGDKRTGLQLLLDVIRSEPNNENAWLWMTQAVSSDKDRLKCLHRVLAINPNNQSAQRGLAVLQQKQERQQQESLLEIPKEKQEKPIPKATQTPSQKVGKTSQKAKPVKKKKSRLIFYLVSTLVLVLLCCCGGSLLNLGSRPTTNRSVTRTPSTPTVEKVLYVSTGQLSKYADEYSKYEEVFVYKKDGTLAERPNDLEELCLDYVFYRRKILEYDAAGETKEADEARTAFQQVNIWLDEYDRDDFETMYFDILKLGN
jgi:predicted nucleic acid-binding Zn ribbon protein